jgi:transketolase
LDGKKILLSQSKIKNDISLLMMLKKIANTIRSLTMDTVEKAGSGHPGLPMGCAELGAFLFAEFLRYDPLQPKWRERDRLILSAGHGSLWLYTCMHLAGFSISIDDLKQFRQFGSKTPSHPDITKTEGVEATTGVDGQGIGYAVGQALALKISNLTSKVVVLAGDGCLMEGISYESCSFAGHLNLNNLILIYDSNRTTLDGYVEESFSENIQLRFKAQGWDVFEINGHDFNEIRKVFTPQRESQKKPTLIVAHTKIGKGSPTKEGTPLAHGGPLGVKEIEKAKASLSMNPEPFHVDPTIYAFFHERSRPQSCSKNLPEELNIKFQTILQTIELPNPIPSRWASHEILNIIAKYIPNMIVGSADLSSSDGTFLRNYDLISKNNFKGRNIKYGVREFAMTGIAAGMAQTKLILPVIGTFLAFSDYMRSAIRMTALMHLKVIYHLTHDSILIGHDGPTHQPIEQISALRGIPGLLVIRPADNDEVKAAWIAALKHQGPTAIILSRQPLLKLEESSIKGALKGAYILKHETTHTLKYLFLATGSEVQLALEVAKELGSSTRVVSMPSWELFEKQTKEYKDGLLQGEIKICIEAGIEQGWHKYIGPDGIAITLSEFGESGSIPDLQTHFGFTKDLILKKIKQRKVS